MADSYPPFTTRSLTRDNLVNRNSSRNNYTRFVDSPKSRLSELAKETSPRQSFTPASAPIPKPVSSTKASMSAAHSRQYSDGSLLGIHARKGFEEDLKEFYDNKNDDSSSSKDWLSDSFKFDAKPAAPSKTPSRGKSVRTFRSFRTFRTNGSTIGAREAGEKQDNHLKGKLAMTSNEVEEAYADKSEPKTEGLINSLSVGLNGQNLGGDSYMPKPVSPENQIREKQECSEDSEVESGEDSERENEDFHESSDDETMSATLSVAGSEVDRKAGEFIAKFREQIRLQRTSSIDSTPRGFNISSNIFR
ncbi:hypothetical protein CCACVL1_19412 [Corchorus capsularis]|uniref:Uncharacterized protein n=1 Tax=Corchorus capsularis TaxID=210143 RepID=A0A1R3HGS5_COCAP|nr:hypothetical protein CCACVL1_19412 [Corchorus capsularis]